MTILEIIKNKIEVSLDEYLEASGFDVHPKINKDNGDHDWGDISEYDYDYIDAYYRTMEHYESYIAEIM